ncbi:MAG TPA: hypothetical protein ENI29_15735 [bacterium]|nr:hypothetical protein [bacterium]
MKINFEYLEEFTYFDVFPEAYTKLKAFKKELENKYPEYKPNDEDNWYLRMKNEDRSYSESNNELIIKQQFYFTNQKYSDKEKRIDIEDMFIFKIKFDVSFSSLKVNVV